MRGLCISVYEAYSEICAMEVSYWRHEIHVKVHLNDPDLNILIGETRFNIHTVLIHIVLPGLPSSLSLLSSQRETCILHILSLISADF